MITILAYSACLLVLMFMIFILGRRGKAIFFLTPFNLDIANLNEDREKKIVRLLKIQYMHISIAIIFNIFIEFLREVNEWDSKILSIVLMIILMFIILYLVYTTGKQIIKVLR